MQKDFYYKKKIKQLKKQNLELLERIRKLEMIILKYICP